MAAYTCLWEFIVEPDHVEEFRQRYGPGGPWVALFRRAPGYLDTLLLRDRGDPRRFITIDRWRSAEAYDSFRSAFSAEYAALDARCAQLTAQEILRGEFDEEPP
jgi:quinol monooxygenase YgiN